METKDKQNTSIYYVAGLFHYVLVHASSPDEARAKGEEKLGRPALTLRLATPEEIGLQAFHDRMVRESQTCAERDLIHRYTRAQAIEDGALVDVSSTAWQAMIKYPVALTRAVWCKCVEVPEGVEGQDEAGRLWDLLSMLLDAIKSWNMRGPGDALHYQLYVRNDNQEPTLVTLKAVCGTDDDAAPCISVMLPEEN